MLYWIRLNVVYTYRTDNLNIGLVKDEFAQVEAEWEELQDKQATRRQSKKGYLLRK